MNRRDQQIALAAALGGGYTDMPMPIDAARRCRCRACSRTDQSSPCVDATYSVVRSHTMSDTINAAPGDGGRRPTPAERKAPTQRKLLLSLLAAAVVVAGAGLRRVLLHDRSISRGYRRRLRQRQSRATDAAGQRHRGCGERRRYADRQAGRAGRDARHRRCQRSRLPMPKRRSAQTVRQVSSLYVNNEYYAATVAQRAVRPRARRQTT